MILLDTHVWVWGGYAMGPAAKLDKLAALLSRHEQTEELAGLARQPRLTRTAVAPKTLL